MIENIVYNTEGYKINTPEGYKDFKGISYNGKKEILCITLENMMYIEASEDHKFLIDNQYVKVKDITPGDTILTVSGKSRVTSIVNTMKFEDTYDILHVDNSTNTFFANGIETSNCKFLGSSQTLIDPQLLEKLGTGLKSPLSIKYNGGLQVYEDPISDAFYVAGVDTAAGSGGDYSVVQVLKISGEKQLEQVAVFSSNTMSYAQFAEYVIAISEFYNGAQLMIENNDIGGQVADLIWHDYEYDNVINVESKRIGVRATKKSKLQAAMTFKLYVENGWLKINDDETFRQVTIFEEVAPNVFKAGHSEHDDHVMAMMWGLYYVNTQAYENKSWDKRSIDTRLKLEKMKDQEYEDAGLIVFDQPEMDEDGFTWET